MGKIVDMLLKQLTKRLEPTGISLDITDKAKEHIVKEGSNVEYGARPLKRAIQKMIEDELSEKILTKEINEGDEVKVDFDGEKLTFASAGRKDGEKTAESKEEKPEKPEKGDDGKDGE